MKRSKTKNIALMAMFLTLAMVLPFLTGQIPAIGHMLLPMHLPVFLCGLICGFPYGALLGFVTPLLRSALFGMPIFFPTATAMAFELCAYGFFSGLFYRLFPRQNVGTLVLSLIFSMLIGRGIWGLVQYLQLSLTGSSFTWALFVSGAFLEAFPGIILQLTLIPLLLLALDKAGFVPFERREKALYRREEKRDGRN